MRVDAGVSGPDDPANGYEAIASEFAARRERSSIGVETVRRWARSSLPAGTAILDLGCGSGVPITRSLLHDGFVTYGVDASPTLAAMFRRRFPQMRLACETVEESPFFGRTFDGILAVGLLFLLPAGVQGSVIGKVAAALNQGGSFLFTCPQPSCTWTDELTGRPSRSLGAEEYESILSHLGLILTAEHEDEGDNHYFCASRPCPGGQDAVRCGR